MIIICDRTLLNSSESLSSEQSEAQEGSERFHCENTIALRQRNGAVDGTSRENDADAMKRDTKRRKSTQEMRRNK